MRRVIIIATLLSILTCSTIALTQETGGDGGIIYGSEVGALVSAPKGWVFDTKSGLSQGLNAVMYPQGSTWENTNETIYVNIVNSEDGTLDLFIAGDIEEFKKVSPSLSVEKADSIPLPGGYTAEVRLFLGDKWGNYECIAYVLKGKSVVLYVLSAKNKEGLLKNLDAFKKMVSGSALMNVTIKETAAPDTKLQGLKEGESTAYDSPLIDEMAQRFEFSKQIENLVKAEKFNELDSIAENLRNTKSRWIGGYKKLATFYEVVGAAQGSWNDGERQRYFEILQKWVETKPDSLTARIALAKFYILYAWFARGGGWANEVTQEGWMLMEERLATARQVLEEAEKMPAKDPELYCCFLTLALGQSWNQKEMEAVFKKGVTIDPTYSPLYVEKAAYLLPRWHGEQGEWAKFAEEAVEMTKETEGTSFYARIVWEIIALHEGTAEFELDKGIFTRSGLSWPKLKQGFEDMERLYPKSLRTANAFCWCAYLAEDWETTRQLFTRIGDRLDKGIWPDFYATRGYAYFNEEEYDKAISDYNQAIKIDPDFAKAYYSRGIVYYKKKEYDKAISDYNQAIKIYPTYRDAYSNRGSAYVDKEEYDKAISDYNQAIKIDPTYGVAYYNRGLAYYKLAYYKKGEYDKAWEDIQKAKSLGFQVDPEFLEKFRLYLKK